MVIVNTHYFF